MPIGGYLNHMSMKIFKIVFCLGLISALAAPVFANNLAISNVALGSRDPGTKTLIVNFDVSWENSWRNKINHDALWLTVRLHNTQAALVNKKLCQISAAGINPAGSSAGTGLEVYVPSDKRGAFVRRSANGSVSNIAPKNIQLTINYDSCGFADNDQVAVSVLGLEMVFIPQGAFYAGDYNTAAASLNRGSGDANPWSITSENFIPLTNAVSNGYHYASGNNSGEYIAGSTFTVPAAFPKGYQPLYVMKYEITEGQWVDFINALGSGASRSAHDITDNNHKNSDSVMARNAIACAGAPLTCSTDRPWRAAGFLSWMDVAAFLDWYALRPITELEFEKISRGPSLPVAGEYAWGSTDITAADALTGSEDGTETFTTANANAHFNNAVLSGGDSGNGTEYQTGPVRGGIFANSQSNRASAGASYYGVMELSGNLKERAVTIGNANGLLFTGVHGDGFLTSAPGYEGNADVTGWPGMDAVAERGVTGAAGAGFRGGSWADNGARLQASDRQDAALNDATAQSAFGGRGARTYDGN